MRAYQDCPGCACLVGAHEAACPFCGQALRSVTASGWLTLGLVLSLGTVSISCGDKDGETDDTVTASNSDSQGPDSNGDVTDTNPYPDGVTYAGPDESSVSDPYASTSDSSDPNTTPDSSPDGSTYAGPDENSTTTGDESSGSTGADTEGSSGSTGDTEGGSGSTTTPDTSDSNGDGATYAGPDTTDSF
ncbi:MAG TPA: hypothetical protein VGB85_30725 [Nannocystis sp.]